MRANLGQRCRRGGGHGRADEYRRDQIAARQLGQHPRVDAVGLARQRRQALDLLRVGDLDLPATALKRVMHEPRPVHRLDRRPHATGPWRSSTRRAKPTQPITVRRRRAGLHPTSLAVEQAVVQTCATEIQSSVQHEDGPPSALAPSDDAPERATRGRPSFMAFRAASYLALRSGRRLVRARRLRVPKSLTDLAG